MIDPDELARRLSARTRVVSGARGRAASVLIPMFERDGDTWLLLIKRTDTLRHHGGQYALPGGGRDDGDANASDTALREAKEEVGIEPVDVRVLGMLDDLATITGFVVTPVVGWIPHPYGYRLNRDEVALAIELPLRAFVVPPRARTLVGEGLRRLVLAFEVDGHFIWGATASILRNLASVVREPGAG
jgi:8-oxo-dGTP pyrophosphatase MutT (NUDIX family)